MTTLRSHQLAGRFYVMIGDLAGYCHYHDLLARAITGGIMDYDGRQTPEPKM